MRAQVRLGGYTVVTGKDHKGCQKWTSKNFPLLGVMPRDQIYIYVFICVKDHNGTYRSGLHVAFLVDISHLVVRVGPGSFR